MNNYGQLHWVSFPFNNKFLELDPFTQPEKPEITF